MYKNISSRRTFAIYGNQMLTNHPNLMVPEHSCDLQHSTVTMPRKMGKTKKFAEKEEKTVIKGTGGQIRQERQFLAGELLRSK